MTSQNRDLFKDHFLFSNRCLQFLTNQCPNGNQRKQLLLYSIVVTYTSPFVFQMLCELFSSKSIERSTIIMIQKLISHVIFMSTYSVGYFRFVTIQLLIARFKLDHEKISDQDELNIIEKYNKKSKFVVYALMFFFDVNCFLIVFPPVLNAFLYSIGLLNVHQLTFPLIKNNISHVGILYYILVIGQTVTVVIAVAVGSISVSTFLVFMEHACCQCSIIRLKIRKPFQNNPKSGYQKIGYFSTPTEEYDWISDIVKRHRNFIEYVEMIKYVSNVVYLIVIFLGIILFMFNFLCILEFSVLLKTLKEKIECIIYVTGSIFSVYTTFYFGQRLLNHSNAVFEELCNVPFYNLSLNTQKLLLFIITRSGKPCFLSIGNMFVSSHEIFASLMQKAFSFAMVYYNSQ